MVHTTHLSTKYVYCVLKFLFSLPVTRLSLYIQLKCLLMYSVGFLFYKQYTSVHYEKCKSYLCVSWRKEINIINNCLSIIILNFSIKFYLLCKRNAPNSNNWLNKNLVIMEMSVWENVKHFSNDIMQCYSWDKYWNVDVVFKINSLRSRLY